MKAAEIRAAIAQAYDAVEQQYAAEIDAITDRRGLAQADDLDRVGREFADRLEALCRPLLAIARLADPASADELQQQIAANLELLRRPVQRRGPGAVA